MKRQGRNGGRRGGHDSKPQLETASAKAFVL